jgi:amino acid adenylation domain-containing protein
VSIPGGTLREPPGSLRTTLTFRGDRFSIPFAHRFAERWSVLLAAALAEPGTTLGRLSMLPAGERSTLVQGWSQTGVSVPEVGFVHASVEAWARRTPDEVALVQGSESLTFATLNGRANGLARRLRAAGVGRDVPVAVYDDPSIAAVVGLLAVLKAGGYYVPLDVSYPERRLRDILATVRPAVFLTRPGLRERLDRLRRSGPGIVLLPDPDADAPTTPDLDIPVEPADLGYVLHTSGSTGQPKGIAMPHESLRRTIAWYPAETGIVPGSRLLQFSPFGFDSHFCEIFGTWHAGATVVLPSSNDQRRDPEALLRLLAAERIDHLEAPNSGLANVAHWAVREGGGSGLRLRTIVTGGEQLLVTPDLVGWLSRLPGCAVRHGYGPTESGPTTTHWLRGRPDTWPRVPPIGRPVTDARVYLLDDALQPVPAGVAGEMYVGGPVLARGYLGAPARTAERFIADPFGPTAGGRLYRTGDLARWTSQGSLEFLGRNDGQVKVRGYRIELAEVEAALLTHPGVTAAAVAVAPGGESLTGYVVPRGPAPGAGVLQQHLGQRLPAFMVPSAFVMVSALPSTPSGKLDRSRLGRGS